VATTDANIVGNGVTVVSQAAIRVALKRVIFQKS